MISDCKGNWLYFESNTALFYNHFKLLKNSIQLNQDKKASNSYQQMDWKDEKFYFKAYNCLTPELVWSVKMAGFIPY